MDLSTLTTDRNAQLFVQITHESIYS